MAKAYEIQNKLEISIEYAERALKIENNDVGAQYYLGILYFKQKDLKKSINLFRSILSIFV